QVAGANHQPAAQIRQPEKMACALAGLHVLEGDVVNLFALGVGMPDVLEHLHAAWPDVYFVSRAAERLHQTSRLLESSRAGRKARHRHSENIFARRAETVHRTCAYQQRMGRIDSARDSDHDALESGRADARREALDLDVEDFGASLVARRGIGGHVRESL